MEFKAVGTDTTRYVYGTRGDLTSVRLPNGTLIEYVNDALGRRIGKKVNGSVSRGWLYASDIAIAAELDPLGQVATRFVYSVRANVPVYMIKDGHTYRLFTDYLAPAPLHVHAHP